MKLTKIILCLLTFLSLNAYAEKLLDHLVLKTEKGPVVIQMDDTGTPLHFAAITKLVEMGIYNGTSFTYAQSDYYVQLGNESNRAYGFFDEQFKLIQPIPAEITDFKHYRGAVTMPSSQADLDDGGEYIFTVMLDQDQSEELDEKQTIIGFITHGIDILDEASRSSQKDSVLDTPLVIKTAVFMTKTEALDYYTKTKKAEFESDIFQFSKYSFLLIALIQLVIFYSKEKIDIQIKESLQLIVMLIAAFSCMAQLYPLVAESTLASVIFVIAMLVCFKTMSGLERSRGLSR